MLQLYSLHNYTTYIQLLATTGVQLATHLFAQPNEIVIDIAILCCLFFCAGCYSGLYIL
jgi:hypothetical protein